MRITFLEKECLLMRQLFVMFNCLLIMAVVAVRAQLSAIEGELSSSMLVPGGCYIVNGKSHY